MSIRHPGSRFARHLEKICNLVNGEGRECCRFDSIRSIRDDSSASMSIRHSGSRFARHLEKNLQLVPWGGSKMLSIRLDSIDSRRFVCRDVDPSSRKSICATLRNNVQLAEWGGSKMLSIRLDSIDSRRFVFLDVDPSSRKSICATLRKKSATCSMGRVENVVDSTRFDRFETIRLP